MHTLKACGWKEGYNQLLVYKLQVEDSHTSGVSLLLEMKGVCCTVWLLHIVVVVSAQTRPGSTDADRHSCTLPIDRGYGEEIIPRWGYKWGECTRFDYTGRGGNANRFA